MPGRLGPGRGRGPVARAGRRHRVAARQEARAAAHAPAPAPEPEPAPAAAPAPPPEPVKPSDCEFPRCTEAPAYGFKDSTPQFCEKHKSDEMVLLVADPDHPKEASLFKARQYKKMEPELAKLKDAPGKFETCKAQIKETSAALHKEDDGINQLTKQLAGIQVDLDAQAKKPKLMGKTLFGKGLLAQDQGVIDKLTKEKEQKDKKVADLKGQKDIHEMKLQTLKADLPGLSKPAEEYGQIRRVMHDLKHDAIEAEATAFYLQLKAKGLKKEQHAEGEVIWKNLLSKAGTTDA